MPLDPTVDWCKLSDDRQANASHAKLRQLVHADLFHYEEIENQLNGFDACFFCLGQSSSGMKEADYERVTYQLTMAAAETLSRLNPAMTFIYVSGQGTDSSERGRVMWARVKGKTENALLRLPFAGAYMFRPGSFNRWTESHRGPGSIDFSIRRPGRSCHFCGGHFRMRY